MAQLLFIQSALRGHGGAAPGIDAALKPQVQSGGPESSSERGSRSVDVTGVATAFVVYGHMAPISWFICLGSQVSSPNMAGYYSKSQQAGI